MAAALGLHLWCMAAAGPYQAIPADRAGDVSARNAACRLQRQIAPRNNVFCGTWGEDAPALEPQLVIAVRAYAETNGLVPYIGDCQLAQLGRDVGKYCSIVRIQSDDTAEVMIGLAFTDAATVVIFHRVGTQ